ncbi:MAG: carboxylating nicotinate-nucleotide diphosphorylase [Cyanobacteriota bacterium]
MELPQDAVQAFAANALREDLGAGDLTSSLFIPPTAQASAQVVLRQAGVIAGLPLLRSVFAQVDPELQVILQATDGERLTAGAVVAQVQGRAQSILAGERVALNFLQHLSGIATLTAQYVAAIAGYPARILDTRKTTPGLRLLEKYAVCIGGGVNHRFGLDDAVLLKDNHLAVLAAEGMDLAQCLRRVRKTLGPLVKIEVEVETLEQALRAADAGADVILLDNMPVAMMRTVVEQLGGRVLLEASGGITLATIRSVAATGVDYVSVGALTHSAPALDIGLDFVVD